MVDETQVKADATVVETDAKNFFAKLSGSDYYYVGAIFIAGILIGLIL